MKIFRIIALTLFVSVHCSCAAADKKEMKASEIIALAKKGKPVQVAGKIIIGDLDFTAVGKPFVVTANLIRCDIPSNIFFEQCVFMGKVTSNGKHGELPVQTCFRNNLVFTGCDFRGETDFDGAVVFGMVNFSRSVFRGNVNFNNMAVWAKDSYFTGINAEKKFSMIYASFAGNLNFFDAAFHGYATFQEISAKGKLMFNNSSFEERAGFDMMEVYGYAFFNYAKFKKAVDFSWARFMGAVEFVNVTIEEQANFEKTTFLNAVNFEGVENARLNNLNQ